MLEIYGKTGDKDRQKEVAWRIFRRHRNSKAYDHGVSYLKKLDMLAPAVLDWRGFGNHDVYVKYLRDQHSRKRSFWPRYEK